MVKNPKGGDKNRLNKKYCEKELHGPNFGVPKETKVGLESYKGINITFQAGDGGCHTEIPPLC